MNASLSSNAALLLATADLAMTRSLLAAIGTTIPGKANPNASGPAASGSSGGPGGAASGVSFEGRARIEPTPRIEPRLVHRPEAVEPNRIHLATPAELPKEKVIVSEPLPTPWQTLMRERVWNRAISVDIPTIPQRPATPPQTSGAMLDSFC